MIRTHGNLRLTDGSIPGGSHASSVDFAPCQDKAAPLPGLSSNKSGNNFATEQ
jgi:hypothetical protein